jgi:molybdopterin-guanine dinucleotide biosynthesis protein A
MATTGVIIAGGRGRRMGRDKALVEFRGRPMATHVAAALRTAGIDVVVVGREEPLAGEATIPDDPDSGRGPAAGLLTALRHLSGDVVLVAVDQPLLRAETVTALMNMPGAAVVPLDQGHPQVTCALYRQACLRPLESLARSESHKLRRLLPLASATVVEPDTWRAWGEDGRSWWSLDTPDALAEAEALL